MLRLADEEEAKNADAVNTRVLAPQRRGTLGLFVFAVAFAYTVTGFAVANDLINAANSTMFWVDMFVGYAVLALISCFSAYPAYKTGLNTSIFFRYFFGKNGGFIPNIIIVFLILGFSGFQTATIGETLFPQGTWQFVLVCLVTGGLIIWATVKGIKGLEAASNIAIAFLVIAVLLVLFLSFGEIGGIAGFNAFIDNRAAAQSAPADNAYLINVVIGSWAIGALANGNFTRFSKTRFSMIGFCIIAFFIVQAVLAILGATSLMTVDTYLFIEYAKKLNTVFYIFVLIAFLLALWTTLNYVRSGNQERRIVY